MAPLVSAWPQKKWMGNLKFRVVGKLGGEFRPIGLLASSNLNETHSTQGFFSLLRSFLKECLLPSLGAQVPKWHLKSDWTLEVNNIE